MVFLYSVSKPEIVSGLCRELIVVLLQSHKQSWDIYAGALCVIVTISVKLTLGVGACI